MEAGNDWLEDGDDGRPSLTNERCCVEVRLLMVMANLVQELSVQIQQVTGKHGDDCIQRLEVPLAE